MGNWIIDIYPRLNWFTIAEDDFMLVYQTSDYSHMNTKKFLWQTYGLQFPILLSSLLHGKLKVIQTAWISWFDIFIHFVKSIMQSGFPHMIRISNFFIVFCWGFSNEEGGKRMGGRVLVMRISVRFSRASFCDTFLKSDPDYNSTIDSNV